MAKPNISDEARSYHSITFVKRNVPSGSSQPTTKNTWDDWKLIPSSRPNISLPNVNYKYVDIPGRNGSIDISDYLVGRPYLSDRSGSFEFYVTNDYTGYNWFYLKDDIRAFLDGSEFEIHLNDESDSAGEYYYIGRVVLKDWKTGSDFSTVSIEYRAQPGRKRMVY